MLVLEKGGLSCFVMEGRACRISCVSGRLWVTAMGRPDDHLLEAGDEVTVAARGKVVIEALRASMARVQSVRTERARPRAPVALGAGLQAFFPKPLV